jgi:hypothetical protein
MEYNTCDTFDYKKQCRDADREPREQEIMKNR